MPVQWTSEADAKLFVGVLNQCHGQLKLDSQRLAQHMGGDCTACAIEQRIAKLKRHAKALGSNSTDTTPITTPAKKNGAATTTADAETPTKPKRKAGTGGRDHANGEGAAVPKKAAKKAKVKVEVQEEGVGEEGFGFFKLEKKDLGGVKKEEEEEEEEEDGAMA
ncbi:hypothetical protein ASPACDRAFT_57313 [Aspergillus aculeatus ATCC 16872]|uniref:Uncharacterized protein n=1 Tax=Aspergillus aculeatus (strain ATCC 16872 / CBS 172.66 / WB 5094) TaxID=690307 RepID=A0A1L9X683_ASPA1|nr:uncharacterized protein ASPACDRAFT_57313 [Aspergillus aculeatus ATCC 16872]OJK03960.1 hypothetical protein ASPACDRAFT_57313 [Aspergillus aculeatus ATCC 16872]